MRKTLKKEGKKLRLGVPSKDKSSIFAVPIERKGSGEEVGSSLKA